MRILLPPSLLLAAGTASAFAPPLRPGLGRSAPAATAAPRPGLGMASAADADGEKRAVLGLVTFDLDDTLYPVNKVFSDANGAFASAMREFGFDNIQPNDIAETGRAVREEAAERGRAEGRAGAASALTFTETRKLAIRKQMEASRLLRSLEEVAKDWATPVSALSPVVVENCKKFASKEVSESQIEAVYNAWEMERHHSAERNLYPEVLDVLARIKEDHPGVVFGAVTDGRANPLLMPFTLAQWFDFCVSWEDDQGGRTKFFTELHDATDDEQLMWIYEAALDKYREISALRGSLRRDDGTEECDVSDPGCHDVWIHVGDDVAYDCGGAGRCGARTVLAELAQKYGQTERLRGAGGGEGGGGGAPTQPEWDLESKAEVEQRAKMNQAAEGQVDAKVAFLNLLPDVINDLVEEAGEGRNDMQ